MTTREPDEPTIEDLHQWRNALDWLALEEWKSRQLQCKQHGIVLSNGVCPLGGHKSPWKDA